MEGKAVDFASLPPSCSGFGKRQRRDAAWFGFAYHKCCALTRRMQFVDNPTRRGFDSRLWNPNGRIG
jgi:hypothetical protein